MTTQLVTTNAPKYTPLSMQQIADYGHNKLVRDSLFSLSVIWRVTLNGETNCIKDYTKKELVNLLVPSMRPLLAAQWDKDGNMKFNKNRAKDVCFDNNFLFQKTSFDDFVDYMLTKAPEVKVPTTKTFKAWSDTQVESQIKKIREMDADNAVAMQKQLKKLLALVESDITGRCEALGLPKVA